MLLSRATKDPEQSRAALKFFLIIIKSKRNHVTPILINLHCLPVKYRIQYKLATLAFHYFFFHLRAHNQHVDYSGACMMITFSTSMYIICVILRLFSALSRRVGALQISIIIIIYLYLNASKMKELISE